MREVLEQGTTFIRGRRRGRGSCSALASTCCPSLASGLAFRARVRLRWLQKVCSPGWLARPIRCVLFKLLHPRVALFACLHVSIRVT